MDSLFGDIHAFIQIIAGLNFAFAASNHYNGLLYNKVVSSIRDVKQSFCDLENKIVVTKQTIRELPEFDNGVIETDKSHKELIGKLNSFEEENNKNVKKLNTLIVNESRTNFFMLICFYAGIYCMSVLLYDAFSFFNYEQIIIFNLLSIFFFLTLFIIELIGKIKLNENDELVLFDKYPVNFKSFLIVFIVFGLISYISVIILNYKGYYCPVKIDFWVKSSSVVLSILHFAWYFLLSLRNSQLISKQFSKKLIGQNEDFDTFHEESIIPAIHFANHLNKMKK